MADNAKKAVLDFLQDNWTRGPSILDLLTDLGPVVRGGDSVDVPSKPAATVNTSEAGAVEAASFNTTTLVVNRNKFINQGITQTQYSQLLNGSGKVAEQIARANAGALFNSIDRDVIEYLIRDVASASAANHVNVAASAVTDNMVNNVEASIREQDGIATASAGLFWLLSPRAAAALKSVTEYIPSVPQSQQGVLGLPMVASVNGIPAYMHNGVPGAVEALRQQIATSAVTVTGNVATATVAAGHGFVAGQQIYTTGLSANAGTPAVPVTISAVSATTITFPLTAADGALADGVGVIYSASSMALLCYTPWIFYALDGLVPYVELVKREANSGWTHQMFQNLGRVAHSGSVRVLHAPA